MSGRTLRARLCALEVKQADFERQHVPLSDLTACLFAVLSVVGGEAGEDVGARCARRLVESKRARVLGLLSGMASGQLEDLRGQL